MLLLTIEFDECTLLITQVKLEKDAVFGIGGSTGGKGQFAGVLLDSKNQTFTVGNESGPAAFAVGAFHKVEVILTKAGVSATLDGKALVGKKPPGPTPAPPPPPGPCPSWCKGCQGGGVECCANPGGRLVHGPDRGEVYPYYGKPCVQQSDCGKCASDGTCICGKIASNLSASCCKSAKGINKLINDGFFIQMSLDRYVMADVDNFQLTA